jgi:hypothetical protein
LTSNGRRLDRHDVDQLTQPVRPPPLPQRELRATGSLGYALSSRLSILGTGAAVRLERSAAASPLTRERNTWEAGLGLSWRL